MFARLLIPAAPFFLILVYWDPAIMEELRRRGVQVPDPRVYIDQTLSTIESRDRDEIAREYARIKMFYFDQVDDPARQDAFRSLLGISE